MAAIKIKILNTSPNQQPEYATEGSSGMDIRAYVPEPVVLKPMERKLIPTGLFIELPVGCEAQIRPRSGLALKQGITCLNTPGTVDSDYRGEIKVLLINLGNEEQVIKNNDRIAQMVIGRIEKVELISARELNDTTRGNGGFGHTGLD
jgi:dUTP pyrophosphatase